MSLFGSRSIRLISSTWTTPQLMHHHTQTLISQKPHKLKLRRLANKKANWNAEKRWWIENTRIVPKHMYHRWLDVVRVANHHRQLGKKPGKTSKSTNDSHNYFRFKTPPPSPRPIPPSKKPKPRDVSKMIFSFDSIKSLWNSEGMQIYFVDFIFRNGNERRRQRRRPVPPAKHILHAIEINEKADWRTEKQPKRKKKTKKTETKTNLTAKSCRSEPTEKSGNAHSDV